MSTTHRFHHTHHRHHLHHTHPLKPYPASLFYLLFILILVIAAIFVYDPVEKAKQAKDKTADYIAREVTGALEAYSQKHNRLPWSIYSNLELAYPESSWTDITREEIGLCLNDCRNEGVLIKEGFANEELINLLKGHSIYLAKGKRAQDTIYACFVPVSTKTRQALGELFQVDLNLPMPLSGRPEQCSTATTWKENDLCFVCVTN